LDYTLFVSSLAHQQLTTHTSIALFHSAGDFAGFTSCH
jgi:hypothetical protein